jgi:hypothetical protein
MMTRSTEYRWLEFYPKPKKDGLHDSGYRYIRLVGVWIEDGEEKREELHQWSDHVLLNGPVNIDVTEDGVIRIMPWLTKGKGGWVHYDSNFFYSTAEFHPADYGPVMAGMSWTQAFAERRDKD